MTGNLCTTLRRKIAAIETRMREREDCGGLIDELAELQAELSSEVDALKEERAA